jgi:hypothetical protein
LASLEIDLLKKITDLGVDESRDESYLNATVVSEYGVSEAVAVCRAS